MRAPRIRQIYFPDFLVYPINPTTPLPRNKIIFRIPYDLSKSDFHSFLISAYNIAPTNIRTILVPRRVVFNDGETGSSKEIKGRYKKAFVTLEEDFEFPGPEEGVTRKDKALNEVDSGTQMKLATNEFWFKQERHRALMRGQDPRTLAPRFDSETMGPDAEMAIQKAYLPGAAQKGSLYTSWKPLQSQLLLGRRRRPLPKYFKRNT